MCPNDLISVLMLGALRPVDHSLDIADVGNDVIGLAVRISVVWHSSYTPTMGI